MSNHFTPYVWEAVSQQMLNKFCDEDGLPRKARHKWIHIWQAVQILKMTPKEIFKEGYRDFLAVRTNSFHYLDIFHHVDGILHPDPLLIHMGKLVSDEFKPKLVKELKKSGLPSGIDFGLFAMLYDDPECLHLQVRKSVRNDQGKRRLLDAKSLPKLPYNGHQLRQMGLWQDAADLENLLEIDREIGRRFGEGEAKRPTPKES